MTGYRSGVGYRSPTPYRGAADPVTIPAWTVEQSQRALLNFQIPGGPLAVLPAVATAPASIVERLIERQSHLMDALIPDADGRVNSDGSYEVVTGDVGVPHLFVSNRDVTYFRDVPVQIKDWSSSQPEGDMEASVEFPQLTPFDVPGVGDLSWLHTDAPAEIYMISPEGERMMPPLFCGHLVSDNSGILGEGLNTGWHLEGALRQLDYVGHKVPTILNPDPSDIGQVISKMATRFVSRRFVAVKPVNTGITTRNRGTYGDTEWDYVQSLLATAWTVGGDQWTLKRDNSRPRNYQLGLKDTTTVHHTLTAGAPGVEIDLTHDQTSAVNCIYGRGVGPDGYSWAGWVFPRLHADTAPDYPYASAGTVMTIGSTDAGTLTGKGVTVWQARAQSMGFRAGDPDGTFSSDDDDAARSIQRRYGLLVDGIVGPQTWNATFAVGSNAGSLWGAYRAPLAIKPEVERYLYTATGAHAGFSPTYNSGVIRREIDVDYGPGVTKAEAVKSAQLQLARDSDPGWAGKITLHTDPHEGSRFFIFEGQNILLLGFRGQDLLLHVVEVSKSLDDLTVTVTVDSKARDAMTLSSILDRNRDSKVDPGRRPGSVNRRSRQEQDMTVEFDGESGAGVIERMALYGGLPTVINIPVSQVGRIAKVVAQTVGPASKFAMALFGKPIQPTQFTRMVGDPLASDNPFEGNADELVDRYGFIEGWGQSGQACGYYPGSEGSGSLTGRFFDGGGVEFVSQKGGWVWVVLYAQSSCFFEGRIWPAPVL